jgi:hypothetical protein
MRPVGTAETPLPTPQVYFRRAYGTRVILSIFPPLKWRAIFGGPAVTSASRDEPVSRNDVPQRSLCGFRNADARRHFDATRAETIVHNKQV